MEVRGEGSSYQKIRFIENLTQLQQFSISGGQILNGVNFLILGYLHLGGDDDDVGQYNNTKQYMMNERDKKK